MVLPFLAGKSLNTKDTTDTKGEKGLILRAFSFVTFVYFVFEKVFPLKTVEPDFGFEIEDVVERLTL